MRPVVLTITGTGLTAPIVLDYRLTPFNISQTLTLGSGGSITATAQFCNDDPFGSYATSYNANGQWFNDPNMTNVNATTQDGISVPCCAVRLNVTAFVAGTTPTTFTVVQAGER